jgi:hypothetical protein
MKHQPDDDDFGALYSAGFAVCFGLFMLGYLIYCTFKALS